MRRRSSTFGTERALYNKSASMNGKSCLSEASDSGHLRRNLARWPHVEEFLERRGVRQARDGETGAGFRDNKSIVAAPLGRLRLRYCGYQGQP